MIWKAIAIAAIFVLTCYCVLLAAASNQIAKESKIVFYIFVGLVGTFAVVMA